MILYSIHDWAKHFENHESRKRVGTMSWIKISNIHDKIKFKRLMQVDPSGAAFGAFILAAEVASKMPKRGVLANDDGPLSKNDMEMITGCNADTFAKMFDICSSTQYKIGWIVATTVEDNLPLICRNLPQSAASAARGGTIDKKTVEENRIEENRIEQNVKPPTPLNQGGGEQLQDDGAESTEDLPQPVTGSSSAIADANMLAKMYYTTVGCPTGTARIQRDIIAAFKRGATSDEIQDCIEKHRDTQAEPWDTIKHIREAKRPGGNEYTASGMTKAEIAEMIRSA